MKEGAIYANDECGDAKKTLAKLKTESKNLIKVRGSNGKLD
ncbi:MULTISPECIES: hypothetical protein [Pectobacterium]|nr:hypothetical protein [Pectobacterium carotovorum]